MGIGEVFVRLATASPEETLPRSVAGGLLVHAFEVGAADRGT